MTEEEIRKRFNYPDSTTVYHSMQHSSIEGYMAELAEVFDKVLPDSREKSLAMTNLEQAFLWAGVAISLNRKE